MPEVDKAVELDAKNVDRLGIDGVLWHAPGSRGRDQNKARSWQAIIMRLDAARGYLALAELSAPVRNATI